MREYEYGFGIKEARRKLGMIGVMEQAVVDGDKDAQRLAEA